MFAGADNPIATSLLTKNVNGDPGGNFVIGVINGNEGPGSEKHGLTATLLTVDESFSVGAGGILLSVSNTYLETEIRKVPTPGTLALLGLGLGCSRCDASAQVQLTARPVQAPPLARPRRETGSCHFGGRKCRPCLRVPPGNDRA